MKNLYKIFIFISILLFHPFENFSQETPKPLRPVTSAFMFEAGGASVLDTYLTPIRYKGYNLALGYERFQAMKFSPDKWIMQLACGIDYSNVNNIVKNRTMHSLMVEFQWGMMHRWNILPGLKLHAGGITGFNGGVIYNQYNSNNPCSAKIRWSAGLTGMVTYNLKIGKLPVTLRYQPIIPVLGAFFSPEYGEAYYEIYLGNLSNIAHFGWWGNRFDMTNIFTADLHFGATSLRVGYRGRIESSWINNINTQIFTNSAIIGISGEWMTLNPGNAVNKDARIISALY